MASKPPLSKLSPHTLARSPHAVRHLAAKKPVASRGPSPGPQPTPEFFPCSLAPAAAGMPLTAEPMRFGARDEVGGALGTAAVGEKPVSRLSSTRGVQSCCASRGALLVSISANVIRTALAACPLQLQALLEAAKPSQQALDRVVERSRRAGNRCRARHHGQRQRGNHAKQKKEPHAARA